ncbi:MAG: hypothetical protein ACK4N5_26125, partial [Myxococcales bacterium]
LGADPSLKPEQLVGTWEGGGFRIVLEKSGTGSVSDGEGVGDEPIQWKLKGSKLALTQDGETVAYGVSLKGETMTLSGGDLAQTVTLQRRGAATARRPKGAPADAEGADATTAPVAAGKGTCEGVCRKVASCTGVSDPQSTRACLAECRGYGLAPQTMAQFVALDCAAALAVLQQGQQQGGGGRGGNPGAGRKECEGCVRDGSECVWLSQGNWGSGWAATYSGAASSCDPSCCGL